MKSQPHTNSEDNSNIKKNYGMESPNGFDYVKIKSQERIGAGQGLKIQKNIPLAPYTTFKIGGPARFFCEVENEEEIIEAVKYAKDNNLEIFILGGGSNILVSDEGFDGLVIYNRITNYELRITENEIECGSGVLLSQVVNEAAKNSLSGLEWAAGIPGTVGGAVRGNAGSPRGCIGDNIWSVRVLEISKLKTENYKPQDCNFFYRDSAFKHDPNLIIISCVLKLKKGDRDEIRLAMKEIIEKRAKGNCPNPKEPSPGSFFKNPVVKNKKLINEFEKDTGLKIGENKNLYKIAGREVKIPAGWLVDQAGLKGKKVGGAQISEKHANFIVNAGQATAQDVTILISLVKQKVRNKFGVELKEEVQYVGF